MDTDDIENGIAYTDVYDYTFNLDAEEPIRLYGGDVKKMPISVLNKGVVVDEDIILTSLTPDIVEVEEDRIIGRKVGEGKVRCALSKNETNIKILQY